MTTSSAQIPRATSPPTWAATKARQKNTQTGGGLCRLLFFAGRDLRPGTRAPPPRPPRWTSVGRRALTPPQRTDSVVPPYGWIWGRCNRADVGIGPYEGVMYHRVSGRPQGSPLRSAARRSVKRGVGDAARKIFSNKSIFLLTKAKNAIIMRLISNDKPVRKKSSTAQGILRELRVVRSKRCAAV